MFIVEIPYEPVPWSPSRVSKFGTYDPKEKDKRAIRYLIRQNFHEPIMEGYVHVVLMFGFSVPKSASKKKRAQMLAGEIIPTRCDCTNLQKLLEDCLKGIVFKDDRMVESISSKKMYSHKPFMMALVYTNEEREGKCFFEDLDRTLKCG